MILAVGDSFTYGDELANRSVSAWPYLIAQLLNQDIVNLAKPGSSNDTILRLAVEATAEQQYDLVLIGWTSPGRIEVWNELTGSLVTVMPDSQTGLPWVTDYYRYSYDPDSSYQQWFRQVVLLQQWFTSRGQPYVFAATAGLYEEHLKYSSITNLIDPEHYAGWPNQGMLEWAGAAPRGPGGHPLELGHERIANEIAKYIRH